MKELYKLLTYLIKILIIMLENLFNVTDLVLAVRKKIYEEPLKHTKIVKLEDLTYDDLYDKETDSNGIPLLKRVERYPELPDDVFIDFEFTTKNGIYIPKGYYKINKKGQIWSIRSNRILSNVLKNKDEYFSVSLNVSTSNASIKIHRIVSTIFLVNPNKSIYTVVNHINNITLNNNLNNLEWSTISTNNTKRRIRNEEYLKTYVACNDLDRTNEVFKFKITGKSNIIDGVEYFRSQINDSISKNKSYKKYYWRIESGNLSLTKEKFFELINCSGNSTDYTWYKHPLYPGISVSKEGFVKYNGKISGRLTKKNYLVVSYKRKTVFIHKIIIEFLEGRFLKGTEFVDHINTNTLDNSFENLRLVNNQSENMSNHNTLYKISKLVILTDLRGEVVTYGFKKDIKDYLNMKNIDYKVAIKGKFFIIEESNRYEILDKIKNVYFVFKDNKLIFFSIYRKDIEYYFSEFNIGWRRLPVFIENGIEFGNKLLVLKGENAIKKLIDTEQIGNSLNFKIDREEFKEKPRMIDYSIYDKFLE